MDHLKPAKHWFKEKAWKPHKFQLEAWTKYQEGYSGLVNAPTGSGKTYSLVLPAMLNAQKKRGLKLIWVTPIRALAKEILQASVRATEGIGLQWNIQVRTGDTTSSVRQKQWSDPPDMLITTPESIHVMMTSKGYSDYFKHLECVVVDEWHELIGSKRGVMMELALCKLKELSPQMRLWGISATIGNLEEATDVLFGTKRPEKFCFIKSDIRKKIKVKAIIPKVIETLPWAGHLGLRQAEEIIPLIYQYNTTLIFTNTRAQCEIWYQRLLDLDDNLAGLIAMHHGSISKELRDWVEDALYEGRLKAVVCTSSLDLGVDFRPVENIIQIGSPKGVSRFVQRAGRSGHQPGATSHIYFLPTHALELVEAAALKYSIEHGELEDRVPYLRSFDVLIQFLMTLAVSEGFSGKKMYELVSQTFCFASMSEEEWGEILHYLVHGTKSLEAYDEFQKMEVKNDHYFVSSRGVAMRHRMSIGVIVSDAMIHVKYVSGMRLGSIEEYFIAQLSPGDVFWFAGRPLELVRFKEMTAQVRNTTKTNGRIPSYMGGRLPLSSQISKVLKMKINDYKNNIIEDPEITALIPLFQTQMNRSVLPGTDELLIEYFETKEGWHLTMFPFEGRAVHEGMAALIAKRIGRLVPITFSISMNDYGFELLSDQKIDVDTIINTSLFSSEDLVPDIQASINAVELAKRKFRDVAVISGLIFQGFPNKYKKERHLQSSSELLFGVFHDYEPDNLLYLQTYEEVMTFQLEEARLRDALKLIRQQKLVISKPTLPTPISFPLLVDRLREKMSTEQVEDRIRKMLAIQE
ncbi:MAG: ligase-associated DNA damage response DEXH box helicase [Saprospiraceae bacterium]|nr:ligase-associated DNA damage response DEXH box helicase [Saprospiraceae bacterium]